MAFLLQRSHDPPFTSSLCFTIYLPSSQCNSKHLVCFQFTVWIYWNLEQYDEFWAWFYQLNFERLHQFISFNFQIFVWKSLCFVLILIMNLIYYLKSFEDRCRLSWSILNQLLKIMLMLKIVFLKQIGFLALQFHFQIQNLWKN